MDGDIPLTLRDRRRFREALAGPFRTLAQAASALDEIDFPLFERSNLPRPELRQSCGMRFSVGSTAE